MLQHGRVQQQRGKTHQYCGQHGSPGEPRTGNCDRGTDIAIVYQESSYFAVPSERARLTLHLSATRFAMN